MNQNINHRKPHIVFYFSDTGGGHRSAAEAIIEAVHSEYGERVTTEMVDILKEYAPWPFNRMGDIYPYLVKVPRFWGTAFYATDGIEHVRAFNAVMWPLAKRPAKMLVRDHPADMIVTVHPFANTLVLNVLGETRPLFLNVVTDLVTVHALWLDERADLTFVSTETAHHYAVKYNIPEEKLRVVGLPVAEQYCKPLGDKFELREKLGWPMDKPIALLVGGGEGMGPLGKIARAIDASDLDIGLVIVCGRNQRLKTELESRKWRKPVRIYGFTREMPTFMRASDFIVTKAGPGTIAEALNAELPIILYSRLPGQEDGNVDFVQREGAGVWAPNPEKVVSTLSEWISDPTERHRVIENCRRVGHPEAARSIARSIGEMLGL